MPSITPSPPADRSCSEQLLRPPTSLLSLPNELLDDIYRRLDLPTAAAFARTCRRMLMIARAYAFDDLWITSGAQLRLLKSDLRWIGHGITELVIELEPGWVSGARELGWPYSGREEDSLEQLLRRIARRLPDLSVIILRNLFRDACDALIEALWERHHLAELYSLSIAEVECGRDTPPLRWDRLAQAADLRYLELDSIDFMTADPDDESVAITELPSVLALRLSLDFRFDGRFPYKLVVSFPNLKELVLTEDWGLTVQGSTMFLSEEAIPPSLESLELASIRDEEWYQFAWENPRAETVLPRFKSLRHLRLGRWHFTAEGILPYLQSLPALASLEFDAGAHASDDLLAQILSGPTALRYLNSLNLDHVEASKEAGPEWPAGCTAGGLARAIDLARARGVAVSGAAIALVR